MAYTTSGSAFQTATYTGINRENDYYTGTCNFDNPNGVFFECDMQRPVSYYTMYYITNDNEEKNVSVLSTRTWFKNDKITSQRTAVSKGTLFHNYLNSGKNVYSFFITGVGSSGAGEDVIYGFRARPICDKNDTNSSIK